MLITKKLTKNKFFKQEEACTMVEKLSQWFLKKKKRKVILPKYSIRKIKESSSLQFCKQKFTLNILKERNIN